MNRLHHAPTSTFQQQAPNPTFREALSQALSALDADLKQHQDQPQNATGCLRGLRQQRTALERIGTQTHSASECFAALRDAYSLEPQSHCVRTLFRALATAQSGSAGAELGQAVGKQLVVLHVSCRAKLDQARQSVRSFGGNGAERHLIVLAADQPTSLGFSYANGVLEIATSDAYEHLSDKVFLSLLILNLFTEARAVLKVDDDMQLVSRRLFNLWMAASAHLGHHYSGTIVGQDGFHRAGMWHGWHLGKCRDKSYENRGHQMPIQKYAHGGRGYYLSGRSIDELAYAYLAHRAYFESRSILYEDATVGLFLMLAGIKAIHIPSKFMGLQTTQYLQVRIEPTNLPIPS